MRFVQYRQLKWVTLACLFSITAPHTVCGAEADEWFGQAFKERAKAVLLATQKDLRDAEFWRVAFSKDTAQLAERLIGNRDDICGVVWIHALLREAEGEVSSGARMMLAYAAREACLDSALSEPAAAILDKECLEWLRANEVTSENAAVELKHLLEQDATPTFEQSLSCVCLAARCCSEKRGAIAELCLARLALANSAPDTAVEHFKRAALTAEQIAEQDIAASAWLQLAETLYEQDNLDEVCAAIVRSLKMGTFSQRSLLRTTRLLARLEQSLSKERLYRVCSVLLMATSGRMPQEVTLQAAVDELGKLKHDYYERISERVFASVADSMGSRLELKDDFSDSLFKPEMDALDANYMTSDGSQVAEMLCRMWGPGDDESDAVLRAAIGYAIWLRYGDSPAGNAGLNTFLDSMKPIAANVMLGLDLESETPDSGSIAIVDQIEESFLTFGLSGTRQAWLGLYMAATSSSNSFKALGNAQVGCLLNKRGRPDLGIGFLHDQISTVSDEETAAAIWLMAAKSNPRGRSPLMAVSSCLAVAGGLSEPTLRRQTCERAVETLLAHEHDASALEIVGQLPLGSVSSELIGEFITTARARSKRELPLLRETVLRHPDVEVGVQAFLRAARYQGVLAEDVTELCQELMDKALNSKVGALASVAEAERLLRNGEIEKCHPLLTRLSASGVSDATELRVSEITADCYLLQGKHQEALDEYRDAGAGYGYANEQQQFGLFSAIGHDLPIDMPLNRVRLEAQCLKGYLLLARGRDYDGAACLEHALVKLRQFPPTTEMRRFCAPAIHGLLSRLYLSLGENELASAHWRHFSEYEAEAEPAVPREAILGFAKELAVCVASGAEWQQQDVQDAALATSQLRLQRADVAAKEGRLMQSQANYSEVLRHISSDETQLAIEVCASVLHGICNEDLRQRLEVALPRFRAWVARSLPGDHRNCSALAVAKAWYRRDDFAQALAEIEGCLATGRNSELIKQAQLLSGVISFRSGEFDKAYDLFEAVLATSSPDDEVRAQVLFFIGYISIAKGASGKAKATLEQLIERHPHSVYAEKSIEMLARLRTED